MKRRRRLARLLSLGCLGLMLGTTTGCSIFGNATKALQKHEFIDEFMISHRNQVMAARAWHREKACVEGHRHLKEVRRGFMEAYADMANGGTGCIPAVAPRDYWGWRYQTANGQSAVNSWFEGYPLGVKAAEQDGVGANSSVRMANFQSQTAVGMTASSPANQPVLNTAQMIPVPGGFIASNGDFVDQNGNVVGKATVEDRATNVPSSESVLSGNETLSSQPDASPTVQAARENGIDNQGSQAYSANLTDLNGGERPGFNSGSNPYSSNGYQNEINSDVINDIFGKSNSSPSNQESSTGTTQAIPFTFE